MKKIMLDAGHGGSDPGTVHEHLQVTAIEKELNLKLALYTRRYIQRYYQDEITTYMTRLHDESRSLQQRCDLANGNDVDLFLSIHCNSREAVGKFGTEIETFYCLDVPDKSFALCVQDELVNGLRSTNL